MAQDIDWLQSRAGMCMINLYSPNIQKDEEHKVICFVDVSNLNAKDGNLGSTGQSTKISVPAKNRDWANLEEKEVVVIKDNINDQCNYMNTEGAVCLFKQGFAKDNNVISRLSNDLHKYTIGFQRGLAPSGTPCKPNMFDLPATDKASKNNNATRAPDGQAGNPEDLSHYANKLCSSILDMTRKEIRDKWESSGKFTCHTIGSHCPEGKPVLSECANWSRPPQERATKKEDPFQADSGFKTGESTSDKSRRPDDVTCMSKGTMLYASQIASDVMLSFLESMKVQKGKQAPSACAVFKEVLLKHIKEIVSDLIDSFMKNLHSVTGALMTDSDFLGGLKKNLFLLGTQKTAEILEAIVKCLFKLLSEDKARPEHMAFASFKSETQPNQRAQAVHYASLQRELHSPGKTREGGPGKPLLSGGRGPEWLASLDVDAKQLLLTALVQILQQPTEKNRDCGARESNTSSFGYIHRDLNRDRACGNRSSRQSLRSQEGRSDYHNPESFKEKGSIILSLIQQILRDVCSNADESSSDMNRG